MKIDNFFAELKRRNVIRAAGLYLVGAWLLTQVASTVLPMFGAPDWLPRSIVILLVIGFVPALIFSWVFELTPQGLKRDEDVKPEESVAPQTARRMNHMIIAVLVLALAYFVFDKFVLTPRRAAASNDSLSAKATSAGVSVPATAPSNKKSIAVLAFNDLSAAHDQEYFGDGLAEELLNVLVQIDGLSVASRTSSFAFKGKNMSIPAIAQALGVANIVEGSVRRAGDRLRVTAQLIDVTTDRHLWSQTFNRDATDIFVIQDEIARSIADSLKVRLGRSADSAAGTENVAAYELYLLGLYHWNQRTEEGLRKALDIFRQATERDPNFARAFAGLSMTYALLPQYIRFDPDLAQREATAAARKAVELDPHSAEALTALALTFQSLKNLPRAVETYDRALAINPRFATARHWKAISLTEMGKLEEGESELRAARAIDPASLPLQSYLSINLILQRRFSEALSESLDLLKRAPDYRNALFQGFMSVAMLGRPREQVALLQRYFRVVGEAPALAGTIVDGIESPERRPAAIAALEAIAPRHRGGGEQDQIANLFALLKAEKQTLNLIDDRDFAVYPHWPAYDFLRRNPRYEAMLAESKRLAEGGPGAPKNRKP